MSRNGRTRFLPFLDTKISKNVTDRHTDTSPLYIYRHHHNHQHHHQIAFHNLPPMKQMDALWWAFDIMYKWISSWLTISQRVREPWLFKLKLSTLWATLNTLWFENLQNLYSPASGHFWQHLLDGWSPTQVSYHRASRQEGLLMSERDEIQVMAVQW